LARKGIDCITVYADHVTVKLIDGKTLDLPRDRVQNARSLPVCNVGFDGRKESDMIPFAIYALYLTKAHQHSQADNPTKATTWKRRTVFGSDFLTIELV
jgi:hypothetical protein